MRESGSLFFHPSALRPSSLRPHPSALPDYGLAALKLSKITFPGAFDSGCQVPPLISNMMLARGTADVFQASVNRDVQVPGTPALSGAVSKTTLPEDESLRIRQYLSLVGLYVAVNKVNFVPLIRFWKIIDPPST